MASVDDFIQALIQVVKYYQYLKGEHVGISPRIEELLLHAAQCLVEQTGDSKVLIATMAKLPGMNLFCICEPHLADEEVFGSQKRKANVHLGFEGESIRLDKMNFFCPWIATKSSKANHASCSLSDVMEELSPKL